jgi:hypothetical protein
MRSSQHSAVSIQPACTLVRHKRFLGVDAVQGLNAEC